jgi:hypothetical protein
MIKQHKKKKNVLESLKKKSLYFMLHKQYKVHVTYD